jgi:hypothetical protein
MPWWWNESEKELKKQRWAWQAAREALGAQKLRADRSLEREWLREIAAEKSFDKRRKDWIYKAEIDAWEKAPWHADEIEKANRARLLQMDRAIDKMVDKLPVSQWGKIEALQEKILGDGRVGAEEYLQLKRLKGAVYNLKQAQFDAEAARAMHDAAWAQLGEEAVSNVRAGAAGISLAITLTWLVAGAAGLAGVAGTSELAAMISGAMMKLGAFRLTMNLVEGATVGYLEGGFNAAVVGGMKRTLPINTMSLYLGPRMPGDRDHGWKRIGFSVLQDIGNAFTLKRGISQYKQLAKRAGASISSAYQRLTGAGDPSLRMPPVKDGEIARINAEWWAERERGQRLVNNFNQVRLKLQSATDRATRVRLSNQLTRQAIRINQSYAAKSILKAVDKPGLSRAFDNRIQRVYRVVDHRVAKQLTAAGFTRGGKPISRTDFMNFRNASSVGTVGMDRDVGLNQMLEQKWAQVVREATPGTEWHAHAMSKLRAAQKASQLARQGGRVSHSNFQHEADKLYKEAYQHVTGASATESSQVLTGPMHPEAYADPHALQNNPLAAPFSKDFAGQTGSVSALKVHENFQMVAKGDMLQAHAIQESARGLAKDIANKLIPLLKARPGGAPVELNYWQAMHQVLDQAGKGNIRPGELLQTLGGEDGIIRLAEQTSAGIQGAIQY